MHFIYGEARYNVKEAKYIVAFRIVTLVEKIY